jgi:tRNA (guanine10-N2)-methyltransferase
VEWLDAIVTDRAFLALDCDADVTAPYGVRAGAKKIGSLAPPAPDQIEYPSSDYPFINSSRVNKVPEMVEYEMQDVIRDLVQFAVCFLKPGGRLVYWLPTFPDEYVLLTRLFVQF